MVMIKEIQVKSALHKLKRKTPYSWDLNIFRGCEHGCRYCFALYLHPVALSGEETKKRPFRAQD